MSLLASACQRTGTPLSIVAAYDAAGICRASVGDRSYVLPRDEAELRALFESFARDGRRTQLIGGVEIPFRCLGGILFLAQRSRLQVGFTSEPTPSRPDDAGTVE